MVLGILLHFLDAQIADACLLTIIANTIAIVSAQSIVGAEPKVSLFVLKDMTHRIGSKAIRRSKVTTLQHMLRTKRRKTSTQAKDKQKYDESEAF